jgi:branched-subunit amino acid aminotransferase/4-amino-4-deoxychorismate lyase
MSDIVLIAPGESISIQPTDTGFAHGFGLFETMRYAEGQLYFWKQHWARLSRSAQAFDMACPPADAVLEAMRRYVQEAGLSTAVLKLSLMPSSGGSRLYVYSRPPLPAPDAWALIIDTRYPVFPQSLLAGHKTHNYMESIQLLARARKAGYADLLRVDASGHLAETTTSNLFFLSGGRLHTPSLETGILPGVVRETLLATAGEGAMVEGLYRPEALLTADAVWVTNASIGLQAIERIDGFPGGASVCYATRSTLTERVESSFAEAEASRAIRVE